MAYATYKRFEACPFQEALLRAGVPRAPKLRRDFLVGNVVHAVMEYCAKFRALPTTEWFLNDFNRQADKVAESEWRSSEDRSALRARALAVSVHLGGWLVDLMEAYKSDIVRLDIEPFYRAPFPASPGDLFLMEARPDLLLVLDNPRRILVFDWKTGGSKKDPIQLAWYEVVTLGHPSYQDGDLTADSLASHFVWVTDGGKVKVSAGLVTQKDRDQALSFATTIAERLNLGDFPAAPERFRCGRCRVSSVCSFSPENRPALPSRQRST